MADWLTFQRGTAITAPAPLVSTPDGRLVAQAIPVEDFVIFELPWFYNQNPDARGGTLTVNPRYGVVAVRPDPAQVSADVYFNDGVADRLFLSPAKLDYQPAKIWVTEAYTETSTQIKLSSAPLGNVLLINHEFLFIAPTMTDKTYDVARGLFDTLPKATAVDALAWDMEYLWTSRDMSHLRPARVRLVSRTRDTVQDYDNGVQETWHSINRYNTPSVPADIRINGSHYPAAVTDGITVSYAFRRRDSQLANFDHDWLSFAGDTPPDDNHQVIVRVAGVGDGIANSPLEYSQPAARIGTITIPLADILGLVEATAANLIILCFTRAEYDGGLRYTSAYLYWHTVAWTGDYANVLRFRLASSALVRPQEILNFIDQTPAAPVAPTYPQHLLMFTRLLVPPDFGPDYGPDQPGQPDEPDQPGMPTGMDGWHFNWGQDWGDGTSSDTGTGWRYNWGSNWGT